MPNTKYIVRLNDGRTFQGFDPSGTIHTPHGDLAVSAISEFALRTQNTPAAGFSTIALHTGARLEYQPTEISGQILLKTGTGDAAIPFEIGAIARLWRADAGAQL